MLRHTSETLMQRAGLPDTLVSRMHGHTELQTDYSTTCDRMWRRQNRLPRQWKGRYHLAKD